MKSRSQKGKNGCGMWGESTCVSPLLWCFIGFIINNNYNNNIIALTHFLLRSLLFSSLLLFLLSFSSLVRFTCRIMLLSLDYTLHPSHFVWSTSASKDWSAACIWGRVFGFWSRQHLISCNITSSFSVSPTTGSRGRSPDLTLISTSRLSVVAHACTLFSISFKTTPARN